MGKNSAHRRKKNQDKYEQRMASDFLAEKAERAELLTPEEDMYLSQMLQDLAYEGTATDKRAVAEANALQDAVQTLERTRKNARLFEEAGVPKAYIDPELGIRNQMDRDFLPTGMPGGQPLPMMQGGDMGTGFPMPVIDKLSKPGVERRIHTNYQYIPELQRTEVVPIVREDTGKALVTELGDASKHSIETEGHTRGTEYMQDRILRLLGAKKLEASNQNDIYDVDFKAHFNDELEYFPDAQSGIDGEIRYSSYSNGRPTNALPVQLLTQIHPKGWRNMSDRQMKDITTDLIRTELQRNPSLNIEGAIQMLEERGDLIHRIDGKAIKPSHDALIMPGYTAKDAQANITVDKKPNIMAPETVHYVPLNEARSYIAQQRGKAAEKILQSRISRGETGKGATRARVYANVPMDIGEDMINGLPGSLAGPVGQVLKTVRPERNMSSFQENELNPSFREGVAQIMEMNRQARQGG